MNILGEPYYKAVAILHAQGIKTVFGGSVGSDVPQAQCVVQSQKYLASGKMSLMLNCTKLPSPRLRLPADRVRPPPPSRSRPTVFPPDSGCSRNRHRHADSGR